MKKFFIFVAVFILSFGAFSYGNPLNTSDYLGRWAEKTSERVVADIYSNQNNSEYQIFITWREDGLMQKDIYRFTAKPDKNGNLEYKNGVHIYRYFDKNNKFDDVKDYSNGSGTIALKDNELVWFDNKDKTETKFIKANKDLLKDTTIKNNLFSITLPEELKGQYEVEKEKNKISIYHKDSKNAGFGGFAFGIKAYKNPSDHAVLPGSWKIGELKDKKGTLYDMVLKHPTDVQYDYTKTPEAPEPFKIIYNIGENINISPLNGSKYFKNQGMKGKDLYKNVLKRHIIAIKEKWDSNKLEKEKMSYMYNVIAKSKGDPLEKIGYAYFDSNVDGIDELFIGEIAKGKLKGVVYDIYTMVNRFPRHVVSGGARDRYFVCDNSFICNEYSGGAKENGTRVYALVENSVELFPQVNFKYDGYENPKSPYFISYSDNEWENVSKEKYDERKEVFNKYERFNFIPLKKASAFLHEELNEKLYDRYNPQRDYFDYSVVIDDFPKDYYYTTVKINKSKERILIVTDKLNSNKTANHGLFYYFAKNGFVYPLGYLESKSPISQSKNYLYLNNGKEDIRFYMSDKKLEIVKQKTNKTEEKTDIKFETIKSADKFAGDFGSPAGDDIKKITIDGFYFEYHKPQYKKKYIKNLMQECIKDGVKTQVQMYSCVVNKLHPKKN